VREIRATAPYSGSLKVVHCQDLTCSSFIGRILDSTGDIGGYTSITIGTDGLGLISHFDDTGDVLKVAHCSNPFCMPYFRRR
jgi:hypothetical protein